MTAALLDPMLDPMFNPIPTIWGRIAPAPELVAERQAKVAEQQARVDAANLKARLTQLVAQLQVRLSGDLPSRPLWEFIEEWLKVDFRKEPADRDTTGLETIYEFCATHGRLASFNAGWLSAERDMMDHCACPTCSHAFEDGACVSCGWSPAGTR